MLQKKPGSRSCQETVLEKSEQLPEKKSVVQKPGETGQQTLCSMGQSATRRLQFSRLC